MSFGYVLNRLREERVLSLRELGKLSGIDHAYIHRLEKNEKTSPSNEVVDSLARTLKLSPRRGNLLRFLVGKSLDTKLIDVFLEDEDLPLELLGPLSQVSFRGKRPETHEDWRKQAKRLKDFLEE